MFEEIMNMATQHLGQQLQDHPEVAAGNVDVSSVAQTAGSSILEQLAGQVSGGNLGGLTEMLSGTQTTGSSPVVGGMLQNVVTNLIEKNGLSPQLAQTISNVAIPAIMNMFNNKVNAAQSNGVDVGSLISGAMSGGGSAGGGLLGGLVNSVLGGGNSNQGGGMGGQILGSVLSQFLK